MALFHDEDDGPAEPVPGLPQALPEDETIVWQGRADGRTLAIHAFHVRTVAIYLGGAALLRGVAGLASGQPVVEVVRTSSMILVLAACAVFVLSLLGWAMARRSLFTVTTKRVVIRHGVAFRKYINVPFAQIRSVDLKRQAEGHGDIALATTGEAALPYLHLWPFARPFRFSKTVPLIRSVPQVDEVARQLVGAIQAAAPGTMRPAPAGTKAPAGILIPEGVPS